MRTAAWCDLDCVARCVYIAIKARYGGPGSNNGRIPYSLMELAQGLHISKATAMRALDRLQDHGFIALTKQGAFSMKVRHATEWRLTEVKCDVTGELATKEFTRWRATVKKQNTVSPENPIEFRDETARVSR